jgi:thiamine monophosphate synthase
VIGGITDTDRTSQVQRAGADCAAMIGAVTKAEDLAHAVQSLTLAMETDA